jgi:RNA polymerase sigma-70 factor (ECF subfamily)
VEVKDNEIINEILNGDKEKYALLIRKYNQRLYRIGKGYFKDDSEVEDVMQEAYIKGYLNLSKFENRSQFSTWITRILINECLQRLKKVKRVTLIDENEENSKTMNFTDNTNPESESLFKELKRHLEMRIAMLPEKYRVIFIMREVEKMNIEETSRVLEITESNVKARLSRAKEMLRTSLMDVYPMGEVYQFHLTRCERIVQKVLVRI